jgi:transcriptional regulator with PAS, ATPase and Fis domain
MNPRLSITATEQTKTSVSSGESQGRTVMFESGVKITKTLQDMGLEFIIDAPNDMTVHSQLMSMSTEERGKAAVAMLTTGMYIVDGNTSSFSMNSALSAFLNSQITSITGNALRTLDLSFGVDNTTTSTGSTQTDYSFKFAKRFWNNRLRITVGGKVSTGADVANQNEQFFNNVTFEYRMNQNSTKYLKLFYDRDSYDWLEGNIGEYGGGFLWRRKLLHFKDMFKFKDENTTEPPANPDSLKKEKVNVSK